MQRLFLMFGLELEADIAVGTTIAVTLFSLLAFLIGYWAYIRLLSSVWPLQYLLCVIAGCALAVKGNKPRKLASAALFLVIIFLLRDFISGLGLGNTNWAGDSLPWLDNTYSNASLVDLIGYSLLPVIFLSFVVHVTGGSKSSKLCAIISTLILLACDPRWFLFKSGQTFSFCAVFVIALLVARRQAQSNSTTWNGSTRALVGVVLFVGLGSLAHRVF